MAANFFSLNYILIISFLFFAQTLDATAAKAARTPQQVARAALTVSATQAQEASTYVSHLSSGNRGKSQVPQSQKSSSQLPTAIQDCTAMMSDSANRLHQSVQEMARLGKAGSRGYMLHLSNVKTWVSSALTDQDMCLNGLLNTAAGHGGSTSNGLTEDVKGKVVTVRKFTSRALSLVNKINS